MWEFAHLSPQLQLSSLFRDQPPTSAWLALFHFFEENRLTGWLDKMVTGFVVKWLNEPRKEEKDRNMFKVNDDAFALGFVELKISRKLSRECPEQRGTRPLVIHFIVYRENCWASSSKLGWLAFPWAATMVNMFLHPCCYHIVCSFGLCFCLQHLWEFCRQRL